MRLLFSVRVSVGLVVLLLARLSHAQAPAEPAALAKRFPASTYGTLVALPATHSPIAEHRTYRLTAAGRWRWPATVRVSTARTGGRILSLWPDAVRPLPSAALPVPPPTAAHGQQLADRYLAAQLPATARSGGRVGELVPVAYVADSATGTEKAGWYLTWSHPDSRVGAWAVVLDEATGQPIQPARDLQCYHRPPGPPRDTTAQALIFRPDPLTTARQPYGRPYVDSLDADRPALNQQRVLDTLWLTFAADSFRLRNAWFEMAEFDPPVRRVVAARTTAELQFGRGAAGFQQVNAFAHLTRVRQYVGQLGYGALHPACMRVDASGLSGADQSRFSPIDTTLSFGEGGVDDAEDADVVTHEYLHALAYAAAPGTNVGVERRTLDEANADYWAAAHSARLGGAAAFGREQVFNWDGHNEFWSGRWVISPKKYPRDLLGDVYLDADVWSATLWQIRDALPPTVADRLFLQHLYAYAPNLTMPQAANLFLQADTLLYGAAHAAVVYQLFDDRHILGTHVIVGTAPEAPAPAVQVWATDAFARGGSARVRAPAGAPLVLLSATGARVWTGRAAPGITEIPATDLAPGVYVLRVLLPGGAPVTRLARF